ncbi:MAG: magnesium transporter CorA family protein [Patescibacteria group bacterium]|nr:magnesium transporter CorA family protein [Patescibacteria group bacterium]
MLNAKHIKTIFFPTGLKWVVVDLPAKKELETLGKEFHFAEQDLTDCLPPCQRPKLTDRGSYLFMILQFPIYNRATGCVDPSEVNFFIGHDYVVTVFNENLVPLAELAAKYQKNSKLTKIYQEKNPAVLMYEILNTLLHYCFPMLTHLSQDIDAVEKNIFNFNHNRIDIIKEIMRIKRNIVAFRKIMQAHKSVIQKLIDRSQKLFAAHRLQSYYQNLVNHTKDIWDFLSNYKDTIDALYETHESLVSHRLNQIIKTLTIFSVIVFPLTLFATIFSMNTTNAMPFLNHPYNFWVIIGIMLVAMLCMVFYFKKKRWL